MMKRPFVEESYMSTALRIGELAKATGVEVETIRYYEKSGLLPPPGRSGNGYRAYGKDHLERLAFVRHCRALDIPLAAVRQLLDFVANPQSDCGEIDQLIDSQLMRVRARLASLKALERQLSSLRSRCATRHLAGDCGILHELVAAAHGESCACHPEMQGDGAPAGKSPRE